MGWRAALIFGPGRNPAARLAGLSLAGRAAAEAVAAGAAEVHLVGASPSGAGLEAELARICGDIPFSFAASVELVGEPAVRIHCERYIVRSAALRPFAEDGSARLMYGDELLAERNGLGAEAADPADLIDLERPAAAARKILAGTAKASDGIVSRWLNRPLSQRVSAALLRIAGIRPWHLTVATAAMALLMFASFLQAGPLGLVLGGILFHVASVMDGIDGEIARATFRTSERGAVLDTTVDMITNLLFYLGVTVSLSRLYGPVHLFVGGWCLMLAVAGLLLIRALAERAGDPGSFDIVKVHYRARYPDGIPARIVAFLVAVTSRDFFAFGNALIILSGWGRLVTWLLAGFATLWLILILIAAPAILRLAREPVLPGRPAFRDI
jgi:CDP-L-myo-inositol myo-inositolphosphotransferase